MLSENDAPAQYVFGLHNSVLSSLVGSAFGVSLRRHIFPYAITSARVNVTLSLSLALSCSNRKRVLRPSNPTTTEESYNNRWYNMFKAAITPE